MSKTALITGASSGIGETFARRLAAEGYHLILVARSKSKLDELASELSRSSGIEVHVIAIDLTSANAAADVFQRTQQLGKHVDLLINNAGFGLSGEFLTHSVENYQQQLSLNIGAVVALTHAFLPAMVQKGEGTIINLASMLAFFPFPYSSLYSASKAFVLSFTEGLWEEYRHKGIHFLALCPGATDTNFFDNAKEVETKNKRTPEQVIDTAMKALGKRTSFVIDGSSNRATAHLARLLPRKSILKMFGAALRKSMQSK